MRGAEFAGCAHPLQANDEERLRKNEVAEAKFFLEFATMLFDKMFGLEELLLDLAGCQIDSFMFGSAVRTG
jgi:hypothetical protein